MKGRILFFLFILSATAFGQIRDYDFGLGYAYASPIGTMNKNIKQGNGFTMDFYVTPENSNRLSFGMDLSLIFYGHDKSLQEYTFSDGTQAQMNIVVDNYFTNLMIGGRYYLLDAEGKKVKPYVTLKGGYSWFRTDLNIYDPDDSDQCKPVETDLLLKDGTFSFSGGAGLHWDLSSVFKNKAPNRFLFNLGVSLTLGGQVNYMNTDAPEQNHSSQNHSDVTAQFINTQTQVVHEHHVGYVYSSYLEMVELRAGFIFRIEPRVYVF